MGYVVWCVLSPILCGYGGKGMGSIGLTHSEIYLTLATRVIFFARVRFFAGTLWDWADVLYGEFCPLSYAVTVEKEWGRSA